MRFELWFYTIPLLLRSLFRRNRLGAELDEELRDHIDRQIEDRGCSDSTSRDACRSVNAWATKKVGAKVDR
jgi:hypothetical protein